jgi:hypothetical protein
MVGDVVAKVAVRCHAESSDLCPAMKLLMTARRQLLSSSMGTVLSDRTYELVKSIVLVL